MDINCEGLTSKTKAMKEIVHGYLHICANNYLEETSLKLTNTICIMDFEVFLRSRLKVAAF